MAFFVKLGYPFLQLRKIMFLHMDENVFRFFYFHAVDNNFFRPRCGGVFGVFIPFVAHGQRVIRYPLVNKRRADVQKCLFVDFLRVFPVASHSGGFFYVLMFHDMNHSCRVADCLLPVDGLHDLFMPLLLARKQRVDLLVGNHGKPPF
jgi:hypothetical protein